MANRSDRRSAYPRVYKRMNTLMSVGNVHHDGEIRRLFIGAHKHYQEVWPKLPLHKNADIGADEPSQQAAGTVVAHAEAQGL